MTTKPKPKRGRPFQYEPGVAQARHREIARRHRLRATRLLEALEAAHPRSFARLAAEIDTAITAERGPLPGDG